MTWTTPTRQTWYWRHCTKALSAVLRRKILISHPSAQGASQTGRTARQRRPVSRGMRVRMSRIPSTSNGLITQGQQPDQKCADKRKCVCVKIPWHGERSFWKLPRCPQTTSPSWHAVDRLTWSAKTNKSPSPVSGSCPKMTDVQALVTKPCTCRLWITTEKK